MKRQETTTWLPQLSPKSWDMNLFLETTTWLSQLSSKSWDLWTFLGNHDLAISMIFQAVGYMNHYRKPRLDCLFLLQVMGYENIRKPRLDCLCLLHFVGYQTLGRYDLNVSFLLQVVRYDILWHHDLTVSFLLQVVRYDTWWHRDVAIWLILQISLRACLPAVYTLLKVTQANVFLESVMQHAAPGVQHYVRTKKSMQANIRKDMRARIYKKNVNHENHIQSSIHSQSLLWC